MTDPTTAESERVLPVAYLRSITHPDWLEVCSKDDEGSFAVYASFQPAIPPGVSDEQKWKRACQVCGGYALLRSGETCFGCGGTGERALLSPAPEQAADSKDATRDVLAERARQISVEGWTPEHDDGHDGNEITAAAAYYAMPPAARDWPAQETGYGDTFGEAIAPTDWVMKDYGDRRRELVVAAALLLAEIERMDRASPAPEAMAGENKKGQEVDRG